MFTKIALVIGISQYPGGTNLRNSVNDAHDVSEALDLLGYHTISLIDPVIDQIDEAIEQFLPLLAQCIVGLFYFAGHGFQKDGDNYLVAKDADFSSLGSMERHSLSLTKIVRDMSKKNKNANILILDACRNIISTGLRSINGGLAPVYAPKGTLIAYATSPGETANDGGGRNGAYTEALLKHISTPDVVVEDIFKRVRNSLSASTRGGQTSWEHTSLSGDFYFNLRSGAPIKIYQESSVRDRFFDCSIGRCGLDLIKELKSSNWDRQNFAARSLPFINMDRMNNDDLFVLGRNIYQAACGSSFGAQEIVNNFKNRFENEKPYTKFNVLNGMLFEIFFDSAGRIRKDFKSTYFNTLFNLSLLPEFFNSFSYISESLVDFQNLFHSIPGKKRDVHLSIRCDSTGINANVFYIREIHLDGANILMVSPSPSFRESNSETDWEGFINHISEEMMIPRIRLLIDEAPQLMTADVIYYPTPSSVKKT